MTSPFSPADFRFFLRQQQVWNELRICQRVGWSESLRRLFVWPQILRTRPCATVPVTPGGPVEFHVMCHGSDWLLAVWMLKSFLHFSGCSMPLVIHIQREVRPSAVEALRRHFPDARLILPDESQELVGRALVNAGLVNCLHWWHRLGILHKLLGVQILAQSTNIVGLDADILFFSRPDELLANATDPWPCVTFQRDYVDSYTLTREQAVDQLGIQLAGKVNTGIVMRAREAVDLGFMESMLRSPLLAKPSGHLEQTLYALAASASGTVRFLPSSYAISNDPMVSCGSLVCRHYAGPSKRWITTEGMRWLKRAGILTLKS